MNPISSRSWEIPKNHLELGPLVSESHWADVYLGSVKGYNVAIKKFVVEFSSYYLKPATVLKELNSYYIKHEHILKFYGYSIINDHFSLIQEWAPFTLQSFIKVNKDIKRECFRKIEWGITVAIEFLHSLGIVHQKLKSGNVAILRTRTGFQAKLCHFSIPSLEDERICKDRPGANYLVYYAPDGLSRLIKTIESKKCLDIYSLGMLLWVIRARKEPYADVTRENALSKIKSGTQETIPSDCSESRASLILGCWNETSTRFTATKVKELLKKIHQEERSEET